MGRWHPIIFLTKSSKIFLPGEMPKGINMVRVYEPSGAEREFQKILTELYLLKSALQTEKKAKLEERINKIRRLLLDTKESLTS